MQTGQVLPHANAHVGALLIELERVGKHEVKVGKHGLRGRIHAAVDPLVHRAEVDRGFDDFVVPVAPDVARISG